MLSFLSWNNFLHSFIVFFRTNGLWSSISLLWLNVAGFFDLPKKRLNTTKFPFEFRMILDNPYASKTMFLSKLLDNYLFFVPEHHIARVSCTERTIIRRGRCYEWVSLINNGCTRVAVWEQLKTIPLAHLFRHILRSFVCKGDEKFQTEQM